jgi:CRP-like cAMP-binding protein
MAATPPPAAQALDSDDDLETSEEPKRLQRPRRGALCAERYESGYYKEPFWNKHERWDIRLHEVLRTKTVMRDISVEERSKLVRAMSTHVFEDKDCIAHQGEYGDCLFVVLEGSVDSYFNPVPKRAQHHKESDLKEQDLKERTKICTYTQGGLIDEISVVWRLPRQATHYARGEQVIVAKLTRQDFVNLAVRSKVMNWWKRQDRLRKVGLLEMMQDEHIAKLVDIMKIRKYEPGVDVIKQGDLGDEFFIMASGEARVWGKQGDDEQEYVRYYGGELFGELALLNNTTRAATVTAVSVTTCMVLSRKQLERVVGPMAQLQQVQYLSDPRRLIADFFREGDSRGPMGTLDLFYKEKEPDPKKGASQWFVVYRPTSKDAIAKMLSGMAVGKGLNVKGKSAKQGVLSGFVPFCQVSDNKHKPMIEQSPKGARLRLYFKTPSAREEAQKKLMTVMNTMDHKAIESRKIEFTTDYEPKAFGFELPEPLLREAYLMMPDLSPVMGWETGRRSEPAFMDMNLHAVRDDSEPKVVLFQWDESDPMNPRGLLIAYAEELVKPVVSDFDTFLVASKGVEYAPVPEDQQKIVYWMLEQAEQIMQTPDHNPWTVRWLDVIKKEGERGFHPKFPKYGYGDPTSERFVIDVISCTTDCGAVRHGAECFNYFFPQELDEEYLLVWDGFPSKPWAYKDEKGMREFLMARLEDGYCFPMNPLWPVRDPGWWDVWEKNLTVTSTKNLESWYSSKLGVRDKMNQIRETIPDGFIQSADMVQKEKPKKAEAEKPKKPDANVAKEEERVVAPPSSNRPAKSPGLFGKFMGMFVKPKERI